MGLAWLLRRFRRVPEPAPAVDPAEELRRKLAESRAPGAELDPEPEPEAPLDDRRRAVHERARASIDRMRGGDQAPPGASD